MRIRSRICFIIYWVVMTPTLAIADAEHLGKVSLQRHGPHLVIVHWDIASNCHLYKQSISIKTASNNQIKIGKVLLPTGQSRSDAIAGKYQVYQHHLDVKIPIPAAHVGTLSLQIRYQGCLRNVYCYPPVSKVLSIVLK